MFVVGTETDHVAPWQSVYKARGLTRSPDYTFLLTSGGHNAGIVSGPAHPRRRHRVRTWLNDTETLACTAWLESTAARGRARGGRCGNVGSRSIPARSGGTSRDGRREGRLRADSRCTRRVRPAEMIHGFGGGFT